MNENIPAVVVKKLEKTIKKAGEIILSGTKELKSSDISEKEGSGNFVTKYDIMVQNFLEREFKKILPSAKFIGEEEGKNENKAGNDLAIIIDPIDGTANFMSNINMSAISVAILYGGGVIYGGVYNPYTKEFFTGIKGRGAYLNGKKISVSQKCGERAIIALGTSPYLKNELIKSLVNVFSGVMRTFGDVRRSGSAALDLCYLAAGRFDGFFEARLYPWDFAAAEIIIKEAGGKISDYSGNMPPYDKPTSLVAGNPEVFDTLLSIVDTKHK